jgi:hypothetical protein
MANYTKATDFAAKDALTTGDPAKIVKGNEIDAEFNAIATAINSKANTASPALTGVPTAPTAASGTNTTQLATTAFVLSNGVPSGAILMWSGTIATVPTGWYLCDGTNGTPNLTNRFIIGADADDGGVAKTSVTGSATLSGGSKDAIVVSHSHGLSTATTSTTTSLTGTLYAGKPNGASGIVSGAFGQAGGGDGNQATGAAYTINANHNHTLSGNTDSAGTSGTNNNLPPYYALAFIMKA